MTLTTRQEFLDAFHAQAEQDFVEYVDTNVLVAKKSEVSATATVSASDYNYINVDTSGSILTVSDMVDGSKMEIHNSSAGDVTLNFGVRVGTATFLAPVTMPSGDSYPLIYNLASDTWVL